MSHESKGKFLISRVAESFQKEFYKKCKELGKRPSDKLRELVEKFLGK